MKRIFKGIILFFMNVSLIFSLSCFWVIAETKPVTIINKDNYYNVVLNFNGEYTHRQVGVEYAKQIKEVLPEYEALLDSYIAEITMNNNIYQVMLQRVNDLKAKVNPDYLDEIEGMVSQFSGGNDNVRGDQKISSDEFYFFNLIPDITRQTQCSAVAIFGETSASSLTMVARNLDWYGGSTSQIPKIQAFITIQQKGKTVYLIGYLGYQGVITGFNEHHVFAAILDSGTGTTYASKDKNSYPFDLRYALENKNTLNDVAGFMKDSSRNYTFNHLIFLADPRTGQVLENNFSGCVTAKRELRNSNSVLNPGIQWGIKDTIGAVNSFILSGNYNNQTKNPINTKRWVNLRKQLLAKVPEGVTWDELKEIISFHNGKRPGTMEDGDLYNQSNQQSILFIPETMQLEVFFHPRNSSLPNRPVFEELTVNH
jgi:hypothetical protein